MMCSLYCGIRKKITIAELAPSKVEGVERLDRLSNIKIGVFVPHCQKCDFVHSAVRNVYCFEGP